MGHFDFSRHFFNMKKEIIPSPFLYLAIVTT